MSSNLRVLIVDDDRQVQGMLAAFLEDEGAEVTLAHTAAEALQKVEYTRPHIAVIDMRLEDMTGEDLIARTHDLQADLRFIVHTGSPYYEPTEALQRIGVTPEDVFLKPVLDMNALVRAIWRLRGMQPES